MVVMNNKISSAYNYFKITLSSGNLYGYYCLGMELKGKKWLEQKL